MKSLSEVRDSAGEATGSIIDGAQKAAYAAVGAPVVAGRKLADYRGRMMESARKEFDVLADEGEKFTEQVRERKLVTEIKDKVDLDQIQGRVTKIKDQLEDVLAGWRDSFRPTEKPAEDPIEKVAKKTTKTTPKKAAAKSS
jgi:hypothetical protein